MAGAIRLLGEPADDIIEARDRVLKLYEEAKCRPGRSRPSTYVRKQLKAKPLTWRKSKQESWYKETEDDLRQVAWLARILRYAAFVIVSYLVGMRVSEILALEVGCITKRPSLSGDETYTFITGRIFKTAPTDEGVAHEWIAPPIAERAIEVLDRLSKPLRKRCGKPNLCLHQMTKGVYGGAGKIEVQKSNTINDGLNNMLAPFIGLPLHDGKQWRLTSHQGRKTFAYLVAKQDRSGLHALKEHLGHRSIVMTDRSYSGHDHEMRKLIGEAAMDEMVHAFADALTATELAGKAGEEIVRDPLSEDKSSPKNYSTTYDSVYATQDSTSKSATTAIATTTKSRRHATVTDTDQTTRYARRVCASSAGISWSPRNTFLSGKTENAHTKQC